MDDEKQQLQKQLEASAEDAASSQIDRNELLHQIHVLEGVRKTLEVPSLARALSLSRSDLAPRIMALIPMALLCT